MEALQKALDAIESERGTSDPLLVAKARALMIGYDNRWRDHLYRTISVEEPYHLPVINPDGGGKSRTFTQGGKFDGVIEGAGRTLLLEHKTAAEDIEDPDAVYWRRLAIDSQVSHYVMANLISGRRVDGTLYDVIKKPSIRPARLTAADIKQILEEGSYCGFKVRDFDLGMVEHWNGIIESAKAVKKEINAANKKREKAGEPLQDIPSNVVADSERTISESVTLYEMRLARDCIDNGSKYFQRQVIHRLDSDVVEYAGELWEVGQSLLHARNNNAHYRNSGACMTYGTPCEFLGVCSGYDTVESDKWERVESVHSELPILAERGGRDLLTNSRVKTFQTCRRKHFYKYELGVRRKGGEEKEALVFGSLVHVALEAWWGHFRKDDTNASSE